MGSLVRFLFHLAQNKEAHESFSSSRENAVAAMTAAGLSEAQQNLLLSGDSAAIAAAVHEELAGTKPGKGGLQVPVSFIICAPPSE
jgi:hypothetical protein